MTTRRLPGILWTITSLIHAKEGGDCSPPTTRVGAFTLLSIARENVGGRAERASGTVLGKEIKCQQRCSQNHAGRLRCISPRGARTESRWLAAREPSCARRISE